MSFQPTPRYSVCEPTEPPTVVLDTNYLPVAIEAATADQRVYDWSTGEQRGDGLLNIVVDQINRIRYQRLETELTALEVLEKLRTELEAVA